MHQEQQRLLKSVFGHEDFREGQQTLIDALMGGRDVLGVMPTGAGKSICYQLPALMLDGVALVISPLISLMIDQVMALKASGVPAAYINSSLSPRQQDEAIRRAANGAYRIIYIAPERLDMPQFIEFAQNATLSLIAVDEAHCVSQWGQDFRPSYLRIAEFVARLPHRPPIGAFTATATKLVRDDIVSMLRLDSPYCLITGYDRPNLHFSSVKPTDKLSMLCSFLEGMNGESGIVYCSTRKYVEEVTRILNERGFSAARYHAGLADEERRRNQDDFQYDRVRVMVATNAFGMGIDKSNVRFVVHFNMPMNLESYYQEAGRAGRDGEPAECLLLYSGQDVHTAKWMIEHGDENPDISDSERAELRKRDYERLKQMTFYSTSKRCLRRFILQYFGESDAPERCGGCSVCEGAPFELDTGSARLSDMRMRARGEKPRRVARSAASEGYDAWQLAMYESLKELRRLLAAQSGMPAYLIFSDTSLHDMVRKRPADMDAFLEISGVGEAKQRKFGKLFLSVLRDGLEPNEAMERHGAVSGSARVRPESAGDKWTREEDERLRDEFAREVSIRDIMDSHGRTRGAIRARLQKLGLIE